MASQLDGAARLLLRIEFSTFSGDAAEHEAELTSRFLSSFRFHSTRLLSPHHLPTSPWKSAHDPHFEGPAPVVASG